MKLRQVGNKHLHELELPGLRVWFSYETPIAFRTEHEAWARNNDWGPTTGRHINEVAAGIPRIPGQEFEERLANALHHV